MLKRWTSLALLLACCGLSGCGAISLFSSPETHHHYYFEVDKETMRELLADPSIADEMRRELEEREESGT